MKLTIDIITQEKHVLTKEIDRLVAPADQGEVTILPKHIPLFTKLSDGVVILINDHQKEEIAILGGFMDVAPNSKVTILSDAAVHADDINIVKAQAAKKAAEETLKHKVSKVEFKQAEASLRRAILELKVARRRAPRQTPQSQ